MPKDERINSIINENAVNKEIANTSKNLKKLVQEVNKMRGEFKKSGEAMRSGGMKATTQNIKQLDNQTKKYNDTQKALQRETKKVAKLSAVISQENRKNIQDQQRLTQVKRDAINVAREQALTEQRGAKSMDTLRVSVLNARAELDRLRMAYGENSAEAMKQQNTVNQLNMEYAKAQQATRFFAVNMDEVRNGANKLDMSLKQMQNELLNLQSVDFAAQGLSPSEIQELEVRMAYLTDGIGDYQAKIKMMATDTIPLFAGGLQTITSVGQGVTGTMRIFGVENKNLEKTMFALMNVSMALTAVQKAYNDKQFVAIKQRLRDIGLSIKKTAVTWLEVTAEKAKTKATKGFFKVLMKNPYLALIAGIVAVGAAIYGLIKWFNRAKSAVEKLYETQKEAFEEMFKNVGTLNKMSDAIRRAEKGTQGWKDAVEDYNKFAKDQNLILIEQEGTISDINTVMKINNKLLESRGKIQAANNQITENYTKLMEIEFTMERVRSKGVGQFTDEIIEGFQEQRMEIMKSNEELQTYIEGIQSESQTAEDIIRLRSENEAKRKEIENMTGSQNALTTATESTAEAVERLTGEYEKMSSIDAPTVIDAYANGPGGEPSAFGSLKKRTELLDIMNEQIGFTQDQLRQMYIEGEIDFQEYNDALIKIAEEQAAKEQAILDARKENFRELTSEGLSLLGAFNDLANQKGRNLVGAYEEQQNEMLSSLEQRYNAGYMTETQYNAAVEAEQERFRRKKHEIEMREFRRNQALSLADIAFNTAQSISKAWSESPLTFGLPWSALAAGMGIAQSALVLGQNPPAYAHGRKGGHAEVAITGDKFGREIVDTGDAMFFTPDKPTLTYIPKDADVIPNRKIESHLAAKAQENALGDKLDSIESAIRSKEYVGMNITREGMWMQVETQGRRVKYINQRLKR